MTFKEDRKRKRIEKREEHIETAKQIQELFPSKRWLKTVSKDNAGYGKVLQNIELL